MNSAPNDPRGIDLIIEDLDHSAPDTAQFTWCVVHQSGTEH
ncbi:hypothetical protein [Thermomonospora catenispora]|nr:hypothetical protein [Thermomonospora catenispora]